VSESLGIREGTTADLATTFALSERAVYHAASRASILPPGREPTPADIARQWERHRSLVEFMAAQPDGRYAICENGDGPVGYARVVRFGEMDQLTELMVDPEHQGQGIGRRLLDECWPGDPTPELGRVVVAAGAPADLSLYTGFGVMPVTGHWHLRHRTEEYVVRRSQEIDAAEPEVHVLTPERAAAEWKRLEPPAILHHRPALHDFFGRDRNCLAMMDQAAGEAISLCWVSGEGEIGPAVGASSEDLVPVVLAALDRVSATQEPENLSVFTTTISWWLLRRLRLLGFRVHWPSWVMCSIPLPGLDRYMPTRPPHVL